jgi:hypothetical protein
MADASPSDGLADRVQGSLYAFLYATVQHTFLGATISGWLKNGLLLLALIILFLGWPVFWPALMMALDVLLRLLYWKARRDGFVRFTVETDQRPAADAPHLADNQKVSFKATGIFSVKDWESYVLERPADYWRVSMGDHVMMVHHSPGRFLYQFIRIGAVESIEAGLLCHGAQPQKALAISYLTSWGPDSEDVDFMFYAPSDENNPSRQTRKMFLAFENESARASVWHKLLHDAGRPHEEEL